MKPFILSSVWLVALLLVPLPAGQSANNRPRFEPADCPIHVPDDPPVDCGYLIVPESYTDPASRSIRMPVLIIHSRSPKPAPDPLLYTEGGPGFSSLNAVWYFVDSAFLELRDVIILEQRGNLFAEPSLSCDFSTWWEEGVEGETPCLDALFSQGIDVTHYSTAAAVADIESLRQALAIDKWNLYGTSYSTRLMLLTMDAHPETVRSVMLQSVSSLTDTRFAHDPEHSARALQVLFADCAADAACAAAYPNLEQQFFTLVAQFNQQPVPMKLFDPHNGSSINDTMTGDRLIAWLVEDAFYGPAWPPHKTSYVPLLIDQVTRGRTDLLYTWMKDSWDRWGESPFAWGLYFAVNCQNDYSEDVSALMAGQSAAFPQLDGYIRHDREAEICRLWQLPAAAPLVSAPVQNAIPTLILAGSYDPITPPAWSRLVAENLENSYYFEFDTAGHNLGNDNPCAKTLKNAFIIDPHNAPDAACMADLPEPTFVMPEDVYIAPGIYELHYGRIGYTPTEEFLFLSSLMVLLATAVIMVIYGAVRLVRPRKVEAPSGPLSYLLYGLTFFISTVEVGWAYGLRSVLTLMEESNRMVLRFGLPTKYTFLFIIPLITSLLTVGLGFMVIQAWRHRRGYLVERLLLSLATAAALMITGLLIYWDILL